MIGIVIVLVWGLNEVIKPWRPQRVLLTAAAVTAVIACVVRTRIEIQYWKNDETLWSRAIDVTKNENNWVAHYALGVVLWNVPSRSDEAFRAFQGAVRINPDYAPAQEFLGTAYIKRSLFEDAYRHYQIALRLSPKDGGIRYNCGLVLFKTGQLSDAITNFEKAVEFMPNEPLYQAALAAAQRTAAQSSYTETALRESLKQNPDRPECLANLAWFLATYPDPQVRNGNEATQIAMRACQETTYKIPFCVAALAAAYAETGQFDDAIKMAELANSLAIKSADSDATKKTQSLLNVIRNHEAYYDVSDYDAILK
jgi:tetratricopeptide (TPR) repeat protein